MDTTNISFEPLNQSNKEYPDKTNVDQASHGVTLNIIVKETQRRLCTF